MSKIEKAKSIVAANPTASRSEIIQMFMSELGMSKAGATTYFYNAKRGAGQEVPVIKNRTKSTKAKAERPIAAAKKSKLTAEQKASAKRFNEFHNKKSRQEEEAERIVKRDEIVAEMDEAMEADRDYLKSTLPTFLKKELGLL